MPLALPPYATLNQPVRSNRENNRRQSVIHGTARTLQDYRSQTGEELSFTANQTFIVLPEYTHPNYYLVYDLSTQTRGLIYKSMVSYLAPKSLNGADEPAQPNQPTSPNSGTGTNGGVGTCLSQQVKNKIGFAIKDVKIKESGYLEVNQDDALLIIDSLDDYFLAKPIGKLGIPGKILKSYVRVQENNSTPAPLPTTPPPTTSNPLSSTFDSIKDKINSNNGYSPNLNREHRTSKLKLNTRRSDGGRGSITSKSFYSAGLELFSNEFDVYINRDSNSSNTVNKDVIVERFIQVDGIIYIPLLLKSDSQKVKIFRRNDELLNLDYQVQSCIKYKLSELTPSATNLNLTTSLAKDSIIMPRLPIFPQTVSLSKGLKETDEELKMMAQYLLDLEVYFFDTFKLELEISNLTKLLNKFFKLRETDFNLVEALKRNLLILNPIPETLPLSQQLNFLNSETIMEEPDDDGNGNDTDDTDDINWVNGKRNSTKNEDTAPLKIKLEFETNLIAFNLPSPKSFNKLLDLIIERTGLQPKVLQGRDDLTKSKFQLDKESWSWVLNSNPKFLYIFVEC